MPDLEVLEELQECCLIDSEMLSSAFARLGPRVCGITEGLDDTGVSRRACPENGIRRVDGLCRGQDDLRWKLVLGAQFQPALMKALEQAGYRDRHWR
jgi:hypothetical protein